MKLQQLRYLTEIAPRPERVGGGRRVAYVTAGVSKQIRALEEELGIDVFVRHGKRLVSVTEPGRR